MKLKSLLLLFTIPLLMSGCDKKEKEQPTNEPVVLTLENYSSYLNFKTTITNIMPMPLDGAIVTGYNFDVDIYPINNGIFTGTIKVYLAGNTAPREYNLAPYGKVHEGESLLGPAPSLSVYEITATYQAM